MTWTTVTKPSSSWTQHDYMRVRLGDRAPLDGTILLGGSLTENTYTEVTPISDTSWELLSGSTTAWGDIESIYGRFPYGVRKYGVRI